MPIVEVATVQPQELFPRVQSRGLVTKEVGARALTVNELTISPGAQVPLHIHPNHEEAFMVLEGEAEVTLGQDMHTLRPGYVALAAQTVPHRVVNRTRKPIRLLAIFPTTEPQRQLVPQ